jgi:hypothetical protein
VAGSHLEVDARPARRSLRFVAGLAVLIALVWFVFLRGDGTDSAAVTLPPDVPTGIEEQVQVAETQPKQAHKETFEVFAPKDPFESLVESESNDANDKGADTTASDGHQVSLDSVTASGDIVVSVDAAEYQPAVGEVFAESFQVVSVDGTCAALLFGDDQFTLCEGQEITK